MRHLIDRDKLLEYIDDNFYPTSVSCYMTVAEARAARERHNMFIDAINNAPVVDAEPVKRGRWKGYRIPHWTKQYDDDGEPEYKYHAEYVCNICGYNSIIKHNYCPHCGAKNVEG